MVEFWMDSRSNHYCNFGQNNRSHLHFLLLNHLLLEAHYLIQRAYVHHLGRHDQRCNCLCLGHENPIRGWTFLPWPTLLLHQGTVRPRCLNLLDPCYGHHTFLWHVHETLLGLCPSKEGRRWWWSSFVKVGGNPIPQSCSPQPRKRHCWKNGWSLWGVVKAQELCWRSLRQMVCWLRWKCPKTSVHPQIQQAGEWNARTI